MDFLRFGFHRLFLSHLSLHSSTRAVKKKNTGTSEENNAVVWKLDHAAEGEGRRTGREKQGNKKRVLEIYEKRTW